MALITTTEVKEILGITGTEQDTQIGAIVPLLPRLVVDYCNDLFINENLYVSGSGISFATLTISDSNSGFVDADFVANMDIYVSGSYHNDGHYLISSTEVTATDMVMDSEEDNFTAEDAGSSIVIYQVQYPRQLKVPVAHLTGYIMENTGGIASERIGDYAVSYMSTLPPAIKDLFKHYKRPHWA